MNATSALRLAVCLSALTALCEPVHAAPTPDALREARAFAAQREGSVSFAVISAGGVLHGRDATRAYASASMTKAMLLVAYLRRLGPRPVPPDVHRVLAPMVVVSGNRAADRIYALVGDAGLADVGRAARMRALRLNGTWSEVEVTAADQARFFHRFDRLVPRRHRAYARRLLGTIAPKQSWGIPRAARPLGFRALFKGGWRRRLVNQGALLETGDGRRLAVVVLTDGMRFADGARTVKQLARRLLRPPR